MTSGATDDGMTWLHQASPRFQPASEEACAQLPRPPPRWSPGRLTSPTDTASTARDPEGGAGVVHEAARLNADRARHSGTGIATRRAENRDSPCPKPGLAVPKTGTRL